MAEGKLREDTYVRNVVDFSRIDPMYEQLYAVWRSKQDYENQVFVQDEAFSQYQDKVENLLLSNPEFVKAASEVIEKGDKALSSASTGYRITPDGQIATYTKGNAEDLIDWQCAKLDLQHLAKRILDENGYQTKEITETKEQIIARYTKTKEQIREEAQLANWAKKRLKEDENARQEAVTLLRKKDEQRRASPTQVQSNASLQQASPTQTAQKGSHEFITPDGKKSQTTGIKQQGTHIFKDDKGNTITAEVNNNGVCTNMQVNTPDGKTYQLSKNDKVKGSTEASEKLYTYLTFMNYGMRKENVDLSGIADSLKDEGKEIVAAPKETRTMAPTPTPVQTLKQTPAPTKTQTQNVFAQQGNQGQTLQTGRKPRVVDIMQPGTHVCKDGKGNTITAEVNGNGVCNSMNLKTPDGKTYQLNKNDMINGSIEASGKLNTCLVAMRYAMRKEDVDFTKIAGIIKTSGKEVRETTEPVRSPEQPAKAQTAQQQSQTISFTPTVAPRTQAPQQQTQTIDLASQVAPKTQTSQAFSGLVTAQDGLADRIMQALEEFKKMNPSELPPGFADLQSALVGIVGQLRQNGNTPNQEVKLDIKKETVRLDTNAQWALNAVPSNVQAFMKENGMLDKNAQWMNSKQLGEYLKTAEFGKEQADKLSTYLSDKNARQGEYMAYMSKMRGASRI